MQVSELKKIAKDVTDEELKDVATVSAGGNEKVRGAKRLRVMCDSVGSSGCD